MVKSKKFLIVLVFSFVIMSIPSESLAYFGPHAKVVRIRTLPSGYKTLIHGSSKIYFHNGLFYRKGVSGFKVISAPIGLCISNLPADHIVLHINGRKYFHYRNTYYHFDPVKKIYMVVKKPVGV
ncbi:MAG: hypothetical protein JXQ65_08910 [Candidatus Marinimicrobia bacterium]|nr:hypothetical protein [Candidatus Neomarinimicrobiota bacterium]